MHVLFIVFTIQSSTITFSLNTTINQVPSQLYISCISVKKKKGKNYTTNCKNFVLTEYTQDFQQGWSVMKWVWSLWNCSKRNSIYWVDIIFGGSHQSFSWEMPRIPRIEVVLISWLGFFTITFVNLAAIWLLADC